MHRRIWAAGVLNERTLHYFLTPSQILTNQIFCMNIYVENLDSIIDNEKLREIFSSYGEVKSAEVVKDVFTDVSRGFGYVEMEEEAAQKAIKGLNETVVNNLKLTVKVPPPKIEQKGSYKVGNGVINAYRFRKN